jgi:DNA-binding NtrC family response regulator
MNSVAASNESGGPPARILVAEYDSSIFDSLLQLNSSIPEVQFELCISRDQAIRKLLASPYHVIISGVYLAELDDFLLLKRHHTLEAKSPFIVTAKASDTDSARQALRYGAFDVIANPIDQDQSRATIRRALWHVKLSNLIATKEKALERYRRYKASSLADETQNKFAARHLSVIADHVDTYEATIHRIQESIRLFADTAIQIERQTQRRALERLKLSHK